MSAHPVDPNKASSVASIVYLAVAGICAIFLHHLLRPGLVEHANLSGFQADIIVSVEMLGIILTTAVLSFVAPRFNWRELIALFLTLASTANAVSALVLEHALMLGVLRFIAGVGAGGMISLSFCMIALTEKTDRNFGFVFVATTACAGLGFLLVPLCYDLIGFSSIITLLALVYFSAFLLLENLPRGGTELLPIAPVPNVSVTARLYSIIAVLVYGLAVGLAVSSFFQAAINAGVNSTAVNDVVIFAQFVGVVGAVGPILIQNRIGRMEPILMSLIGGAIGVGMVIMATDPGLYWAGIGIFALMWCLSAPCILATLAEFDDRGTYVLYGICLQIIGYATGVYLLPSIDVFYQYQEIIIVAMTLLVLTAFLIFPGLWAVNQRDQMAKSILL